MSGTEGVTVVTVNKSIEHDARTADKDIQKWQNLGWSYIGVDKEVKNWAILFKKDVIIDRNGKVVEHEKLQSCIIC